MVLKGKKWSKNVQYGLKRSLMVPNGPKWSTKIYHKFNRMVFITRFNLVLVWSKIFQNLTKRSSKWVRHNQVSWSSFFYHSIAAVMKWCIEAHQQLRYTSVCNGYLYIWIYLDIDGQIYSLGIIYLEVSTANIFIHSFGNDLYFWI